MSASRSRWTRPGSLGGLLILDDLATNGDPGKNCPSQESQGQDASNAMHPPRPLHHPALRLGPVLLLRQQPDVRPFQGGWQVAVLGLGVPRRRPFRQPQFRPPSPGLPLLAGQPVPQGVDQVIVCELVVLPARCGLLTFARRAFRVGGRDQAKLGVQDVDQVVEVPGAVRITRCFEQLLRDLICPLMSVPLSGSRAFSTAWAAFW